MIKKILVILLSLMVSPAFASELVINFNGNLVDKKCEIKQSDITVQFIPYSLGYIEIGGNISDKKSFAIEFQNCTPTLMNKIIKISLDSTNVYRRNGVDYLKTQGGTGLIVGLESMSGEPISFNQPLEVQVTNDSKAELVLNAFLTKGDFAKPGTIHGTASVMVNYN
ncbi:TPA: fimbrial protein [Providencia stuartii]|uniref:Fimbrial protein n=4 Tax=Providencia stuartii TaxID=588 RepID=A0AAJ1N2F8_PROST|nr:MULTISPECIES: fimbrial protein [Providencia]SST03628.1 P pilus assembly protein, pilin FimA [Acinetobacter baumannii]AFH93382.1 fimbrial subunit [Providencia stuartii MRSN 2154]AIN65266.1 fimbrial family protein [Providencia stuartii]AMG68239.1 type 1 fimbrial protein [Providencia stuartii]APG51377.1 fimbrial protein [Providencia stuartii]